MHQGLAGNRAGINRRCAVGVLVHQMGQKLLVKRAPVGTDADGFVVLDRDIDDGPKLPVFLLFEADVAGIDAVFIQRLGTGRVVR